MNMILKTFLSMSLSGSLLILALFAAKHFWKDKISRQWQYYIWFVVMLRLLLPFGPETNLMGKTYQAIDQAITQASPLPVQPSVPDVSGVSSLPAAAQEQDIQNTDNPAEEPKAAYSLQETALSAAEHLWMIWMVGALLLLIRKITVYQSFLRYVTAGSSPVSDVKLLDKLSLAAEQMNIKKPVELCINPLISSPLLTGLFHPCIVLPSTDISERDFQYIVLHELTHYKRRDMFCKWLVQITVCLHWFNPLVHLMGREMTKACEFSCDEAVLVKMGCDKAQDYGKTLLDAMAAVGKYKESLGSITLSGNKQLLKERLGAIMKFKRRSRTAKFLTSLLTLWVVLVASFIGIYKMENSVSASGIFSTTDKPSLFVNVSSAAVNVLSAPKNEKIYAEFNQNVYKVEVLIDNQKNEWKVSISCKTNTNINSETIKLYIPDISYDNVNLNVDNGYLTCNLFRSGNIMGNFNMASVFLILPEGFAGSVDTTTNSGYFQLVSKDDFKNSSVTIVDNGRWSEIYKPKNFRKNGNIYTFSEGTGSNLIKVTQKGSGVMGIYTSDTFNASHFANEWEEKWMNHWLDENNQMNQHTQSDFSSQAEQYYQSGSLPLFQISFSQLDEEAQNKWLDRIYTDKQIMFWGAAVGLLDEDCDLVLRYAEKIYGDGNIAYFSVLANHMSRKMLETYRDKSLKDEKWAFQSVLYGVLGQSDEFGKLEEEKEKEWDEAQKVEYQAVGVTVDGKNYYYQGQLVHIFLDQRANKSFYTLQINPAGTANIKILRNADNKITGAAYMTKAEVEKLFGDMEDEDISPEVIPVDLKSVTNGTVVWLGEYTLSDGDKIQYDISAEMGKGMQVAFAKDE